MGKKNQQPSAKQRGCKKRESGWECKDFSKMKNLHGREPPLVGEQFLPLITAIKKEPDDDYIAFKTEDEHSKHPVYQKPTSIMETSIPVDSDETIPQNTAFLSIKIKGPPPDDYENNFTPQESITNINYNDTCTKTIDMDKRTAEQSYSYHQAQLNRLGPIVAATNIPHSSNQTATQNTALLTIKIKEEPPDDYESNITAQDSLTDISNSHICTKIMNKDKRMTEQSNSYNPAHLNTLEQSVTKTSVPVSGDQTSSQNAVFLNIKIEPLDDCNFTDQEFSTNSINNSDDHTKTDCRDELVNNLPTKPLDEKTVKEKALNKETALTKKFEILRKLIKAEPADSQPGIVDLKSKQEDLAVSNSSIHTKTNKDKLVSNLHSEFLDQVALEKKSLKRTAETALMEKLENLRKLIKSEPSDSPSSIVGPKRKRKELAVVKPFKMIPISKIKESEKSKIIEDKNFELKANQDKLSSTPTSFISQLTSASNISIPLPVDELVTEKCSIDVMKWFNFCAIYDKNSVKSSLDYISKFSLNVNFRLFHDSTVVMSHVNKQGLKISEDFARKHWKATSKNSEIFGFEAPVIHRTVTKLNSDQLSEITVDTATTSGLQQAITSAAQPASHSSIHPNPSSNLQPSNDSSDSSIPTRKSSDNFGFGVSKNKISTRLVPQAPEIASSISASDVQVFAKSHYKKNSTISNPSELSVKKLKGILSNFDQSCCATSVNLSENVTHNSQSKSSKISKQHDTCIPSIDPEILSSTISSINKAQIPAINRFFVSEDLPSPQTILGKRSSSDSEKKNKISTVEYKKRLSTQDLQDVFVPSSLEDNALTTLISFLDLPSLTCKDSKNNICSDDVILSSDADLQATASTKNPLHQQCLSNPDISSNINKRANFPVCNNASISSVNHDPHTSSQRTVRLTFSARKGKRVNRNIYKDVGKNNINNISDLLLHWNADWLRTQKEIDSCPPICELYPNAKFVYSNECDYYNTYLPLHLLNIWFRMFDTWKNERGLKFICTCDMWKDKSSYVEIVCSTTIHSTDILPKRDDFALCSVRKPGGGEAFLLVKSVLEKSIENGNKKKLKIGCCTAMPLVVVTGETLSLHILMNARIANLQNEAFKAPHPFIKNVLLHPQCNTSNIEFVQLQQKKSPKEMRNDILKVAMEHHSQVCLVETTDEVDIILLLTLVAYALSKNTNSKILVILKNDELFPLLVRQLMEYNPVLAVRNKEVFLNENMMKLTFDYRHCSGENKDIIVNSSRLFLTTFSSYYVRDLLSKTKVICIVQDADMCTEAETILPLVLNVIKLILIGQRKKCPGLPELLYHHGYGRSLFLRLLKVKKC